MFPQGIDAETALATGIFREADTEVLPCEVLLIVLSLLGIIAAALVELLNQGWFVATTQPFPVGQTGPVTKLEPKHHLQRSIGEEPPLRSLVPKEGLTPASEVRAVVKNTFLHFEEEDTDDKPPSPLSRSMPIGMFNHTLKAELLQQTIQPRSPSRAAPTAVATVIEEEPLSPQAPQAALPVVQQHHPRKKYRIPRSARKKRLQLANQLQRGLQGLEWEPCVEPEVVPILPSTPMAGGATPRSSTSSATTLCLQVLVPESGPSSIECPPVKVRPRLRHHLSLVKELAPSFEVSEPRVIEPRIAPLWGQFLD